MKKGRLYFCEYVALIIKSSGCEICPASYANPFLNKTFTFQRLRPRCKKRPPGAPILG